MQNDPRQYHAPGNLVHVGRDWVFEIDRLWANIDEIVETDGITLDQIGAVLSHSWTPAVIALALGNVAVLRVLIAEAP